MQSSRCVECIDKGGGGSGEDVETRGQVAGMGGRRMETALYDKDEPSINDAHGKPHAGIPEEVLVRQLTKGRNRIGSTTHNHMLGVPSVRTATGENQQ